MEFGVSLVHSVTADRTALRDLAQAAEALGFASLWTTEHIAIPESYTSRFPYSPTGRAAFPNDTDYGESMVVLTFLAAVTERVRLGVGVIPLTTRHPVFLAKQAASVDVLSGGRLDLGLGAGWLAEEADVLGQPKDHRTARLEETIDILRKAWSDGSFSHEGRFWRIAEVWVMPKPPQGPRLPIWIGGSGAEALRITRDQAVGNIVLGGPDEIRAARAQLHRPERPVRIGTLLALRDSDDVARARAVTEAGADLLIVNAHPRARPTAATVAKASADLERFAREVVPLVREIRPGPDVRI